MYVFDVHKSSNMFGCASMRDKEYCILNKQYTKNEYEKLVPQIIEKMRGETSALGAKADPATGDSRAGAERGEFFPSTISLFGYNETLAHEYFPLTKKDALRQ
jgi:hypothetical protein